MPFEGKNVPHVVIEVNQKCNISCTACYKSKFNYTKPVELIKNEIDFAARERELSAITLAGGEPTLHPQLDEIIRYIAEKKIAPKILSNGYALTGEKLKTYKSAGLSEVFLHIDSMQRRGDVPTKKSERELNPLRDEIAERVVRAGLPCSLALTLYQENFGEFTDVVRSFQKNRRFSRFLITGYTDFDTLSLGFAPSQVLGQSYRRDTIEEIDSLIRKNRAHPQTVRAKELREHLEQTLNMSPFAFVGSNFDSNDPRWLMYYSFSIIAPNGEAKVLHLGESFSKIVDFYTKLREKKGKPHSFGKLMTESECLKICLIYGVFSFSLKTFFQTLSFLAHRLRPGTTLVKKSMTFQQGPSLNDAGAIDYCKDCPDATVRDGVLVPVCLADTLFGRPAAHIER